MSKILIKTNVILFILYIFLIFLFLICIGHLMYGNCQSSKYHYLMQAYWMPQNAPILILKERYNDLSEKNSVLKVGENYTGEWYWWPQNGGGYSLTNYLNGKKNGKSTVWDEFGNKLIEYEWVNNTLILEISWSQKGTLNKKEYYGVNGDFQKRELFEKGELIKTEMAE